MRLIDILQLIDRDRLVELELSDTEIRVACPPDLIYDLDPKLFDNRAEIEYDPEKHKTIVRLIRVT